MSLQVIEGGTQTFRVSGSIVRHLDRDCPTLARARRYVFAQREVDLWPGFVCDFCRRRHGNDGRWPYDVPPDQPSS